MITVMTNGRGIYAAAVGDLLFLPSGRGVPAADAAGWAEAEEDVERLSDACRSAARVASEKEDAALREERSREAEARRNARGREAAAEPRASERRSKIAGYAGRARRGSFSVDRGMTLAQFEAECADLLARIEDLPEAAEDFAGGVAETVSGMRETARRIGRPTDNMAAALEGCASGVAAWER